MSEMNFQVNLQGMIELLSKHLYSNPGVFARELLQNGVDAITARKKLGHSFEPKILIELYASKTVVIHDNGIGLTEPEIHRFLSQIGSTSKREELDGGDDYIGQFGVGMLSCFVVSTEIVLITRSALEGDTLEWRGRQDGTYTIRKLKREAPIGTSIYLTCKEDYEEYYEWYKLEQLMTHYGEFLPVPILLSEDRYERNINGALPPWQLDRQLALDYGETQLGHRFLEAIPIKSLIGEAEGIAYILPYAVSLQAEKKHKVYVKRMLLSDQMSQILPEWAFFVTCIVNVGGLKPTASRESFIENELFFTVRDELGQCLKRHLMLLALTDPDLFEKIVKIHYVSLKAMAVEDDELYQLFIRHLSFETPYGMMRMGDILQRSSNIVVSSTLDEFRQVARVAKAQNVMVINGGYVHDFELVRKLEEYDKDTQVGVLDPINFTNLFQDLTASELITASPFLSLADKLLERFQCRSAVKRFEPAELPVLYNTNEEFNFLRMAEQTRAESNELFGSVLDVVIHEIHEVPYARLCFNYNNPIVQQAIDCGNPEMQKLCIETLYTQSLLLGHYPMSSEEMKLMNMSFMSALSIGLGQAGET
ncbi:HSP90 family protein [Paenibacillus harenae]|uniref:Molecular chaperone HtpG n=1 Tax=Paenibacillus harenae TaxID=306543 RepID=A0ABT9U2Z8_PAEHA|nr:HSP90 family protein [Paenibacillus harenae]MDQ0112829.1 molecular chaperone HtpG [Paenibacillus harenae]